MAIPDFQSVMRPVLLAVSDGAAKSLGDVREAVKDHFGLSEQERKELLPSGNQTVINNRVGWARTYLNKAGLLTIPERGMVQITKRGQSALQQGPDRLSVAWLKQFPEFHDFHSHKSKPAPHKSEDEEESLEEATPDEQLASAHQSLMASLADEVLDSIRQASPTFFEKLVVDLMISMG